MDLSLNENFDIELDDRNDLPLVSGRDEFEQNLAIRLTAKYSQVVGTSSRSDILTILEVEANRVVQDSSIIDSMVQFEAAFDEYQPNLVNVTIIYNTGDTTDFNISE